MTELDPGHRYGSENPVLKQRIADELRDLLGKDEADNTGDAIKASTARLIAMKESPADLQSRCRLAATNEGEP